jgi:hypothetical protein
MLVRMCVNHLCVFLKFMRGKCSKQSHALCEMCVCVCVCVCVRALMHACMHARALMHAALLRNKV